MNPWFWAWIVLVAVFALGESATGSLLVLPWALGAAAAALLDALGLPIGVQWAAFLGISGLLTIVGQRFLNRPRR